MDTTKQVAILPIIQAMSDDDRKLLKAAMDAGPLTGELAKFDEQNVREVVGFLERAAAIMLP